MASWRREPSRLSATWVAYRQANPDPSVPALWQPVVLGPQPPGRWHGRGEVAQYFGLDSDAAWAELIRHEELTTAEARLAHPRCLWQCWITERDIADLSAPGLIERAGLLVPIFFDLSDWEPCQALAQELRTAGYRGLLSPNAPLAGAINLTLFGERQELRLPPHAQPDRFDNRRPDFFVLVNRVTHPGHAPAELISRTRVS